jgi:hypothetical protein
MRWRFLSGVETSMRMRVPGAGCSSGEALGSGPWTLSTPDLHVKRINRWSVSGLPNAASNMSGPSLSKCHSYGALCAPIGEPDATPIATARVSLASLIWISHLTASGAAAAKRRGDVALSVLCSVARSLTPSRRVGKAKRAHRRGVRVGTASRAPLPTLRPCAIASNSSNSAPRSVLGAAAANETS